MKRIILGFVMIAVVIELFVFFGKQVNDDVASDREPEESQKQEKLKVAATTFPLFDIVRTVGADKVEPVLILQPGASPHTFEATPSKVKELENVQNLFVIGAGLDDWSRELVDSQKVKVVDLSKHVRTRGSFEQHEEEHEEEDGHHHGKTDPHYWLSPENAQAMAIKIAEELAALDLENAEYYSEQASNFTNVLAKKDSEWKLKFESLEMKKIVVFHDAWGYFADHFGLEIIATFEPFPGKTPSPSYLAQIQDEVRANRVKTLFVEPQLSQEALQTLADDLRVGVEVLDPLGGISGRESYIELMDFNVSNIAESLKGVNQ